jgi:hypothetical protein
VNGDDEWTRSNAHALSGIRTHDLSFQAINASDRAATVTDHNDLRCVWGRGGIEPHSLNTALEGC